MKWLYCILFLLILIPAAAQNKRLFFSSASHAADYTPGQLALELTAPHRGEREKVYAIFRWIADNIAYRTKSYPSRYFRAARRQPEAVDTALDKLSVNEIVAYDVLRKREAVCNGYARLFKTLCDYAGIRSEIITGYARTNMSRPEARFRSNHTWNAVIIDSAWHLLDVTWASGFISGAEGAFVQQYNDYYFLTPPQQFIRDHYPEDIQWTLLTDPPSLREYHLMPFRLTPFIKYSIRSFYPATGIIEAVSGDTVRIVLETTDPEKDRQMAAERPEVPLAADSSKFVFLQPDTISKSNRVHYTFVIHPGATHLNIMYNNDVVLRYRLHVRKEE